MFLLGDAFAVVWGVRLVRDLLRRCYDDVLSDSEPQVSEALSAA